MADDVKNAASAPVVLRIKVRYDDVDAFVERFAPYCGRAGLFLRTKAPKPVGTEVRFDLRLADDRAVLVGIGTVRWSRDPDPQRPAQPPGMAIEFTRVTKESRGVILQILELRRKLGMVDGPRGLPTPPDDDVAVTAATTAAATATAVAAAAPSAEASRAEASRAEVPAVVATPAPATAAAPAPESTWKRPAVAALEPLQVKPRRPSPAELATLVATPGERGASGPSFFDDVDAADADLDGVLARARALIVDVDRELAALLEDQAVPASVSTVDEASAGLAGLLGTAPVPRARRSRAADSVPNETRPAFVAPPPVAATITADLVPAPAAEPEARATPKAAPSPSPAADPERTKVVSAAELAALTAAPAEGVTRVVSLDALAAATAQRDDDERTRIVTRPPAPRGDADVDPDDSTLDFDRPPSRDRGHFSDEPETFVRARAAVEEPARARRSPPAGGRRDPAEPPRSARPARRTTPPPPPPPPRKRPAPPPETLASAARPHQRRASSSGSIDLTDLVSELEQRSELTDAEQLGKRLAGDALDAAGLIADLGALDRRRPADRHPDSPFPDLASFADPPTNRPRRADETADDLEIDIDIDVED
jgi:uncharacterized protein (TIGR02266 family)